MTNWKKRFRRFEHYYKHNMLQKQFTDKIKQADGPNVLRNWFQYCIDKHGEKNILLKQIIME